MDDRTSAIIKQLRQQNKLLQDQNQRLRAESNLLKEHIETLERENRQLREQLQQAQTAAARQAAPFRRDEHNKIPPEEYEPSGQKPGHKGYCRKEPDHIDEVIEAHLDNCPRCGGPISDRRRLEQIIEEIPAVRPHTVKLITYSGRCQKCGQVRSSHALQTSVGQGAARVQLGPRALSLAAALNKVHGLTMRKTCDVLRDLTGLRVTAGGVAQGLQRVSCKVKRLYEQLVNDIRASPAVFADETSWYVGSAGWWLWVFTNARQTVYRVDDSRGSKVMQDVLGQEFKGMLVSDCLSSYDPSDYAKHKCIAHHLRAISDAMKLPGTPDQSYLQQWRMFFKAVIARKLSCGNKTQLGRDCWQILSSIGVTCRQ